eukprot:1194873-Rhodomonas_salina.1
MAVGGCCAGAARVGGRGCVCVCEWAVPEAERRQRQRLTETETERDSDRERDSVKQRLARSEPGVRYGPPDADPARPSPPPLRP